MVTRLPGSAQDVPAPLSMTVNSPPYPTDSRMPSREGKPDEQVQFEHLDAQGPSAPNGMGTLSRQSSVSSHDTWNSGTSEGEKEDVLDAQLPEVLIPGPRRSMAASSREGDFPDTLVPGIKRRPVGQEPRASSTTDTLAPRTPLNSSSTIIQAQQVGSENESSSPSAAQLSAVGTPASELDRLSLQPRGDASHHLLPPSQPPPPTPSGVVPSPTGYSTTSQSSNPWQKDLDRAQEQRHAQDTNAQPPAIPSSEHALPAPLRRADTGSASAPEVVPESLLDVQTPSSPQPPPQAPVPPIKIADTSPPPGDLSRVDSPLTQIRKQRGEVYHIKHISWFDGANGANGALRRSPILTQNANGPCPLLALVNALSLTTPAHEGTALIHHLNTREHITLGLLLDAVFEELVRRGEQTGSELPDIGDLYSFLLTLHTGMNVNPAFTASGPGQPGGFEKTKEMEQYGAFDIPLVHGWTVPFNSGTYMAFERSARTFDEALNVQFLEEEFENKLRSGGLNKEEQRVFEDLSNVKQFLTNYPTQLSDYGLDTIASWLQPGKTAILFRNDHFCTLYKEPARGTLMTLVTDAGYATHDEVVWESLVDVNGASAQLFSGDFRPVGATPGAPRQDPIGVDGLQQVRWLHKMSGSGTAGPDSVEASSTPEDAQPATTSHTEQEDLDLALALQLQEEEEQASRRAEARRSHARAESLSRHYLQRRSIDSGSARPPSLPPRHRSRSRRSSPQAVNPSARTNEDTVPPPTYEEAASDMPYREAGSTPRLPRQGNALDALSALNAQRHQSAFAAQSGGVPQQMAPHYPHRPSHRFSGGMPAAQGQYTTSGPSGRHQEERCVVM